jgi:CHASE2 domain-containing sensor protein
MRRVIAYFKNNQWINRVFKVFFFYVAVVGLLQIFGALLEYPFMSIPNMEFKAAMDLSLNDLHYTIDKEKGGTQPSENILLVNSGDLSNDSFRFELATLIQTIDFYEPAVIGIDHDFIDDTSLAGTVELIQAISGNSRLVLGKKEDNAHRLDFEGITYGDVMFPHHSHTVRRYSNSNNTFAAEMALKMGYNTRAQLNIQDTFGLNFVAQDFAELDFNRNSTSLFRFSEAAQMQLPLYKGKDIIEAHDVEFASELFKNKAVIIGHFGSGSLRNIRNDLEDKFAVPCDTNLLFRQKTMPGALIHANALENLIQPGHKFLVLSDLSWFNFLEQLMVFLYIAVLLYVPLGKTLNVLMLLGLSLPFLFLILFLMQYGYYIEMSGTLLQLLVYEELVEIFTPLYKGLKKQISKLSI